MDRANRQFPNCWLLVEASFIAVALAGCAESGIGVLTDHIPPYVASASKPANVIERALASCKEKTETEEAKCVKAGVVGANLTTHALAAMIPNCRIGSKCQYRYTTSDRLGYLSSTAAWFTVRWQVDFDLRAAPLDVNAVVVEVKQIES